MTEARELQIVSDLEMHAADDCGGSPLDTHIAMQAAAIITELAGALEAVELARNTDEEKDWLRATKLTDAAIAALKGTSHG